MSTIKYSLIQTFMQLGYNVLITDMDLVYLDNPFKHLHRYHADPGIGSGHAYLPIICSISLRCLPYIRFDCMPQRFVVGVWVGDGAPDGIAV